MKAPFFFSGALSLSGSGFHRRADQPVEQRRQGLLIHERVSFAFRQGQQIVTLLRGESLQAQIGQGARQMVFRT